MIEHNEAEMDQFKLHQMLGRPEFGDLLEIARQTPKEIHLFSLLDGSALVAVALSAEAKQELRASLQNVSAPAKGRPVEGGLAQRSM